MGNKIFYYGQGGTCIGCGDIITILRLYRDGVYVSTARTDCVCTTEKGVIMKSALTQAREMGYREADGS